MRNRCSVLTDLFLSFAKVGCFTFGGAYSAIPPAAFLYKRLRRKKPSPIALIVLSAILGILLY